MATLTPTIRVVDADGQPVTGDAPNLTLSVIADGVATAYSGDITEVDDGEYSVVVTQAGTLQSVSGASSTSGAIVIPARWQNFPAADPLLNAVPGDYAEGSAGYALGRIDDIETAVDGISGGSGAHAITLYVKDEDGNPIAGAAVSIPTAGTQTSAASTGAVNFNLDAGTYTATIRSSAAYTPDASYTVTVNASGAVTAPADAVLEVAAASLPAPSSPDNYLLWCDETQVDYGDVAFGEGEMTVEIVRMSQAARKNVDDNKYRSFVQRSFSTDANGQWSIEIPKDVVEAGGTLTLRRRYTDENGYPVTEDTTVILDADMAEDDDTLAWTALQSTDNE